jgi:hypothetical protein
VATVREVYETITFDESNQLHPEQWIKVYGVFSNRCDYIITCQVYQLETVLSSNQRNWWDDILLEPIDEEEQPMPVQEAMKKCSYF